MPRHFPGLLKNPSEPASALRVNLVLSGDVVEIESNDVSLGQWRCSDVEAARSDGNWFRLDIDDEDWRFLPDTPTEFLFYGIPQITVNGAPRRSRRTFGIGTPDLLTLGRIAVGAVLSVFLLSIGMLIGRYRLDDSSLPVLAVLLAAGGLGAWWTIVIGRRESDQNKPAAARPLVLPSPRTQPALSVQEVIATAQQGESESTAGRRDTETEGSIPYLGQQTPVAVAEPEGANDDIAASKERLSANEDDTLIDEERAHGTAEQRREGYDDSAHEPEPPTKFPHPISASDNRKSPRHRPATDDLDTPEAATDAEPPLDTTTPSPDPTASVAELLDQTAGTTDQQPQPDRQTPDPTQQPDDLEAIDLTVIRGIGPAISTALTQLGVTDVRDLAILTEDDLAYLEERLGRFAPRARTRQWIEQARHIVTEEDTLHTEREAAIVPSLGAPTDPPGAGSDERPFRDRVVDGRVDGTDSEPSPDEQTGPAHAPETPQEFERLNPTWPEAIFPGPGSEELEPEAADNEETAQDEPVPTLNPSISVADRLDQTAGVTEQTELVASLNDRTEDAPPIELTAIKGIGPAISTALTQLGVTDVRDLAILTEDDLAYLEKRLGRFAPRTRTREWIEQARHIVTEEDTLHTV